VQEINDIIARAYTLFSGNKACQYLDACTHCCMSPSDAAKIQRLPLRQIPLALLQEYQDAAKPQTLVHEELKYFAPRYLELISQYQFPSFEPALSLSRFGHFEASDWTSTENDLLTDYALCFFEQYLYSQARKMPISPVNVLLMFYKGNFPLDPLLNFWRVRYARISVLHYSHFLADFSVNTNGNLYIKDAFANASFSQKLSNWLQSKVIKRMFKQKIELAIVYPKQLYTNIELAQLDWQYELLCQL